MDSVKPSEVANSFESYYKHELDREREDDENIKFYDERENITRAQVRTTREDIRDLEARRTEYEASVRHSRHLQRTETEFWTPEDYEFHAKLVG